MAYLNESRFFEWVRKKLKVEKPEWAGMGEWEEWENKLKKERPVAWFLTESLPNFLDNWEKFTVKPYNHVRYYFVQRFVDQSHVLRTGLKKGQYHGFEDRALHGLFNELVRFVEYELAEHSVRWDPRSQSRFKVPLWAKKWYFRWGSWHNADAGADLLFWEMSLDHPLTPMENRSHHQANKARETFELYNWWKHQRPNRKTPSERAGLIEFDKRMDEKYGVDAWMFNNIMTTEEEVEQNQLFTLYHQYEEHDKQEDMDMMVRLIKHSPNLWT